MLSNPVKGIKDAQFAVIDPVRNVAKNTVTDIDKNFDTNLEILSKTKIEELNYNEFAQMQFANGSETKTETMTKTKVEVKKLGKNIELTSEELIEIDGSLQDPGNSGNPANLFKNQPINTNFNIKNSLTVACQRCDKTFSSVKDLKIHIDTLHLQG